MRTDSPARPGTPTWFDLMSQDPDTVQPFYAAVMGWEFTPSAGPEMGHYRMALRDGHIAAGLGKRPDEMRDAWTTYLATDDVDALTAAVREAGGKVLDEPMQVADAGRMAIFADPGGAVFGAWEAGRHIGAQIRDEPGAMCWCEVNTPDATVARAFYERIMGLTTQKMEGMAYWTLQEGEKAHAGILQMTEEWEGVPPHWMCYFAVDSADEAGARAAEHGGKVCVPPFDTPYGRMSVLEDPFGAVFSVMSPVG